MFMYEVLTRASQLLASGTTTEVSSTSSHQEHACMGAVLFLQLVLGWWLPTAVLYWSERRSRAQFLLSAEIDHTEDLFMVKVERDLEHSVDIRDHICRIVMLLISLARSLWFLVLVWELLRSWLLGNCV